MKKINPEMIILARDSRGITQTELTSLVKNLNQGNLSKMEKGLLKIPVDVIKKIAEALGYPLSFFNQEIETRINPIYYRKKASITRKRMFFHLKMQLEE